MQHLQKGVTSKSTLCSTRNTGINVFVLLVVPALYFSVQRWYWLVCLEQTCDAASIW